jgi:dihydrofolate reductase
MRKVIVQTEITLDAVQDNPQNWAFDFHNDEVAQYMRDQLFASDTLVMGRVTYEAFAEVWPTRAGTDEIADRINNLPKFVASRTLQAPLKWNATLLKDVVQEIAQLKQQPGQNILQYGTGELTRTLMQHGLIDELHYLVFPVVVGDGQRTLEQLDKTTLKFLQSKSFSTGVVALHYQPQKKE